MTVTSAKRWKGEGTVVELPSGNVARLRAPDVLGLVMENGAIPDVLAKLISAHIDPGAQPQVGYSAKDLGELASVLTTVCKACFVEPRMSEVESDDSIRPVDVSLNDKMFVMTWAMGAQAAAVRTFPRGAGQNGGVDAVRAGEALRTDAGGADGGA